MCVCVCVCVCVCARARARACVYVQEHRSDLDFILGQNSNAIAPSVGQIGGHKLVEPQDIRLVLGVSLIIVRGGVALHVVVIPLQPVYVRELLYPVCVCVCVCVSE